MNIKNSFNLQERIQNLYIKKLPFVIYHKPNYDLITCIYQKDTFLHILNDFSEKGFIFAPFEKDNGIILFPKEKTISNTYSIPDNITNSIKEYTVENESKNKKNHQELVQKGIDYINDTEISKVVLSRKEILKISTFNFIKTFINSVKLYPNSFSYVWYHPKIGMWFGTTPEILLCVKKNRFKIMSLAGTQPYKNTKNVNWKSKEISEQQIVTDYIISCCTKENIKCSTSKPYTIQAGNILHIRTDIQGVLTKSSQMETLINVLHPTPAVCGMPKTESKKFILKNEGYNREFYTGFLGELNMDYFTKRQQRNVENHSYKRLYTETNLFVNLRCMQIKENELQLYLGGGITKDSIPLDEYKETVFKSKVIKNIL